MRSLLLLFAFFGVLQSNAQIGGERTYTFLELVSSPRHAALGGFTTTLSDLNIDSGMVNPALVSNRSKGQFSLNVEPYFAGINRGTAAYVLGLRNQKALLVDVKYIHYGSFDARNELGEQTGTFTGSEVALGLSYAHYFLAPNLHVGIRASVISSKLEQYHSWGWSADLGVYYQSLQNRMRYALVFQNMGTQITTYVEVYEPLPFNIHFGISNQLEHLPLRWHFGMQQLQRWDLAYVNPNQVQLDLNGNPQDQSVNFLKELSRHVVFGAEMFPDRAFSFQIGYNFLRAAEMKVLDQRSFSGLSLGFGINIRKFRFQFSHTRYTVAGNSNFFGLTFKPKH
jgi:hypothetical protein